MNLCIYMKTRWALVTPIYYVGLIKIFWILFKNHSSSSWSIAYSLQITAIQPVYPSSSWTSFSVNLRIVCSIFWKYSILRFLVVKRILHFILILLIRVIFLIFFVHNTPSKAPRICTIEQHGKRFNILRYRWILIYR